MQSSYEQHSSKLPETRPLNDLMDRPQLLAKSVNKVLEACAAHDKQIKRFKTAVSAPVVQAEVRQVPVPETVPVSNAPAQILDEQQAHFDELWSGIEEAYRDQEAV